MHVEPLSVAPPRWAVWCAWAVPLAILPSALWRASLLFVHGDPVGAVADGGWYLLLLSVLSLVLGLLTLGLVQPWGTVLPRWLPGLGGRVVSARAATSAAVGGALAVMGVEVYGMLNATFGFFHPEPLIETGFLTRAAPPGPVVGALYLPLLAWGPLLLAVALDYHRRRTPVRTLAG